METKTCRKCRTVQNVKDLHRVDGRLVCIEPCKWHTSGKPAKKSTPKTEEIIETLTKEDNAIKAELDIPELDIREDAEGVVVTSAQNNTHVHDEFYSTLKAYCELLNYQLVVIPYTYAKTDDILNSYEDDEHNVSYPSELRPFLCKQALAWNNFTIHGNLNLRPTAANPLSGLNSITNGRDSVFGHPQIRHTPLASAKNLPAVRMMTTGSVTEKNYRQQPTGIKGEFHHSFGALVLLPNGQHWQITATNDGSFIDRATLYKLVDGDLMTRKAKVTSLVMGDLHVGYTSASVVAKTKALIKDWNPEKLFVHDVFDGNTISHHDEHNPFSKWGRNFPNLDAELQANIDLLNDLSALVDTYIVASNHDDFLSRWLMRTDWKTLDTETAKWYLKLAHGFVSTGERNAFKLAIQDRVRDNVTFLELDDSLIVDGVEQAMHGHVGANGGKGSPKTLAKHHSKSSTGHVHYASITMGNMTAGHSTDYDHGYNRGFSSWQQAHIVQYENGKRQHVYFDINRVDS